MNLGEEKVEDAKQTATDAASAAKEKAVEPKDATVATQGTINHLFEISINFQLHR